MEMNIAQKLLAGSIAIDKMRNEIGQLIKLLIGHLNQHNLVRSEHEEGFVVELNELHFDRGVQRWIVGRYNNTGEIFIELEIRPWEGVRTIYNSCWGKDQISPASFVQGIYGCLPDLVDSLSTRYPILNETWKPLLKASE